MKKPIKIIIAVFAVLLAAAIFCTAIFYIVPMSRQKKNRESFTVKPVDKLQQDGNYIHFLNTGSSDAILLESQGHFALIDSGEDTDNPRGLDGLELQGYEDKVLAYLKEHAKGADDKVHLDFIVGTHSHSDHIGGFDTIIADSEIIIDKAYLKQYDSSRIMEKETKNWDNQEVYDQMVNALNKRNIPIISKPESTPFTFGGFTVTFFNTEDYFPKNKKVGENDQSIGALIERNGTKVFLAADLDNKTGDEKRIAPEIGKVDLLKVGHHSNMLSTSGGWLRSLMPTVCIVTNKAESVVPTTLNNITRIADSTILITGQEDGVIAEIGDGGEIQYYNSIH